MTKFIQATNTGKGFITHQDQEIDGLSFRCFNNLVIVKGIGLKIDTWKQRVGGTEISLTDAVNYAKSVWEAGKTNRITQLQNETAILQNLTFDFNKI